jgi:recombination protein RecA
MPKSKDNANALSAAVALGSGIPGMYLGMVGARRTKTSLRRSVTLRAKSQPRQEGGTVARKTKAKSASSALATAVNTAMERNVVLPATDPRFTVQRVPIGIHALERVTGGGFARGRHIELFGDESTGKSMALYMTMVLAQQRGEICALVDGEHVFDEVWFRKLGGDPDKLLGFWPKDAEEAIKVLMLFAESSRTVNGVSICGIDSVASMLPREELEKDVDEGDDRVASRARMMSKLLRRVTTMNRSTVFIWTNQMIDSVSAYSGPTTPGGRALKFYATTRVELRRGERVKENRRVAKGNKIVSKPQVVGHWIQCRSAKEKSARPYMEASFYFDAERAEIDTGRSLIHLALQDGLIERSGNTFSYVDGNNMQFTGTEKQMTGMLRDNHDIREELEWAIGENTKLLAVGEDEDVSAS